MKSYQEVKQNLMDHAYKNNIPLVGEFELTGYCNFSCEMCYAKSEDKNLSKEEWITIFNKASESGMTYALLTGGEVFLHPDFIYLYNYLFDLGVRITLYTNGSYLSLDIVKTLEKRPPELVAITLYGSDKLSYIDFTKSDSFDKVSANIDLLISKKLNIVLRTIPLPKTYENLDKIITFAKDKKLYLGYFLYVSKTEEKMERLNALELMDFEYRMKKAFPVEIKQTDSNHCGAFRNGFFVNHQGYMQGCAMMPVPSKKISNDFLGDFKELRKQWDALLEQSPCRTCDVSASCFTCLAKRYLEGNMFECSEYLKDYAMEVSK